MRPRTLDEVIGQDHIVGPGRLLRRAIQADRLSSVIFYGPPGTGKTSLARVIANTTRGVFENLNAVFSGIKDIREAIDRADERRRIYGRRTILFVDEVHRWNKAQQDALLPWVENGTVILVGATTENPFFEVNRALVSRSRIFQLKSLTAEDLRETARRTLADKERGYGKWNVVFEEGAMEHLVEVSGGDARSLLNALELAVETSEWTDIPAPLQASAAKDGGVSKALDAVFVKQKPQALPPAWKPGGGRTSAEGSRASAAGSRASADGSRTSANDSRTSANDSRTSANDSRTSANDSRTSAAGSRASADDSRTSAKGSQTSAEGSQLSAEGSQLSSSAPQAPAGSWPPPEGARIVISLEAAEESIQKRAVLYDRDGDYHFDTISAFIKSVRGSDPDAALYWLAKMVRAGEDPSFIFRRMIILAGEDVGLADPRAIEVVIACAEAFDRIGFPEGNFPLAQACLYLATAPKSNSTMAFFDALKEVDREDAEVPNHLRDANRDAEGFGHGEGYIYPHAYRDHWAAQQYLPAALRGKTFYTPSSVGYEEKIRDEVLRRREIQAAIVLGEAGGGETEILSWSAASKGREGWFKRLSSGRGAVLLADRDALFARLAPARHDRLLIPLAHDGLLLWEALRRVPEGLAAALVDGEQTKDALERFAAALNLAPDELPRIALCPELFPAPAQAEEWFGTRVFDGIALREPWKRGFTGSFRAVFAETAAAAARLLETGGRFVLIASPPALGQRVSGLLPGTSAPEGLAEELSAAEEAFFRPAEQHWTWTEKDLVSALVNAGFDAACEILQREEERLVTGKELDGWFNPSVSSWGARMEAALGKVSFAALKSALEARTLAGTVLWRWKSLLVAGRKSA
jgi:putative ATPase